MSLLCVSPRIHDASITEANERNRFSINRFLAWPSVLYTRDTEHNPTDDNGDEHHDKHYDRVARLVIKEHMEAARYRTSRDMCSIS